VIATSVKVHCHVSKKVTFADVTVTFTATSAKSQQRGVKQNSSKLQGEIFKKKITGGKTKLTYFVGG
jgi:hypothetical protein